MKNVLLAVLTLSIGLNVFGQNDSSLVTVHVAGGPGLFQMHDPVFSEKYLNGRLQTFSMGITSVTAKKYTEVTFKVSRGASNEKTVRESFRNFDLKIREGFSLSKENNRALIVYAGYGIRTSPFIYDQVDINQKKLAWYTVSDLSYYQSFLWRRKNHTAYVGFLIPVIAVASSPKSVVLQKDASDVSFLVSSIYSQSKLTSIPDYFGLDLEARYDYSLDNKFTIGIDINYSFSNSKEAQRTFRQQMTNVSLRLGYRFFKKSF